MLFWGDLGFAGCVRRSGGGIGVSDGIQEDAGLDFNVHHKIPPLSRLFPLEDITVVVWQRDQIVDLDGKPLFADSPRVLHEIAFSLDEEEIDLRKAVTELSHLLRGSSDVIGGLQRY